MRIVLQAIELVLYLIALAGTVLAIVVFVTAKHDDPQFPAATTLAAVYMAMPPLTLGIIGLAGGAALTALDRLRQER